MDLKIFFSPIRETLKTEISGHDSYFHSIRINDETMPEISGAELAFIGLPDKNKSESWQSANAIRKKLYNLKKGNGTLKMVDLGNLNPGVDHDETILRIKEVSEMLIDANILPILVGGSHDYDMGQFRAYESMEKLVSVLMVDSSLDLNDPGEAINAQNHLHRILVHEPNFLFHYSHLAYQSYLTTPSQISLLEKLYFESFRLGYVREHMDEMEPVIRNADMMSFDIGCIRSQDAPGGVNSKPFGLTGEEACQICWYAGLNEKMSSVGFYEYDPESDDKEQSTAFVISVMIWYFIEGFNNRKDDMDFKRNDYIKYVVPMKAEPETITFYKSKLSEKWWLEVPYPQNTDYERNYIVPCNYRDYECATQGQVPERWINTITKL